MPDREFTDHEEIQKAYLEWDRAATITNFRMACYLGVVLMPAGTLLDHFVYPAWQAEFFKARLLSAVLIGGWLGLLVTAFARKHCRWLGVALALLPSSFMAYMIYRTDGAASPYYAGLNLVVLVVGFVMHWTFRESLLAVSLVLLMYVAACLGNGHIKAPGVFFNNLYFLVLTGIIVATGRFFHSKLRFREFALRYQLDKNKKQLEAQNAALETANRQIKEAEAELVQSEKLASLGRMSAGIIHEINNPLNFAKTGLYTLKNKGKYIAPEQREEYLDIVKDVEDGFNRVSGIVSSLRGFTHHDDEIREDIPVVDLLESSLRFVSHEWSNHIRLEKNLTAGQTVYANKNKLIQVCLNLLENSLDALKIKQFPAGESPTITISSRTENGLSLVTFHDNGPGIKPEILGKVFDPFFTTKDVGDGMGMGLSICHRIVQSYGGEIRVQSEPGKYCEFTLEFPAKE